MRTLALSVSSRELTAAAAAALAASFLIFFFGVRVGRETRSEGARGCRDAPTELRLPAAPAPPKDTTEEQQAVALSVLLDLADSGADAGPVPPQAETRPARAASPRDEKKAKRPVVALASVARSRGSAPSGGRAGTTAASGLPRAREAARSPVPEGRGWSVQIGITRSRYTALVLARALRGEGYATYIIRNRRGADTWHRVRLGGFRSLGEASQAAVRLRREGKTRQAFVVSE